MSPSYIVVKKEGEHYFRVIARDAATLAEHNGAFHGHLKIDYPVHCCNPVSAPRRHLRLPYERGEPVSRQGRKGRLR